MKKKSNNIGHIETSREIEDTLDMMEKCGIHNLPVFKGRKIIGMISNKELKAGPTKNNVLVKLTPEKRSKRKLGIMPGVPFH